MALSYSWNFKTKSAKKHKQKIESNKTNLFIVVIFDEYFHVIGIRIENWSSIAGMSSNCCSGSYARTIWIIRTIGAAITTNAAIIIVITVVHCHAKHTATA